MLMKPNFSRDANLLPASSVGGFGAVNALKKLKSTLKAVITKVVQKFFSENSIIYVINISSKVEANMFSIIRNAN